MKSLGSVFGQITFGTVYGQGSLNYPFWGESFPMQMHGNFEGFPLNSAWFGLVI